MTAKTIILACVFIFLAVPAYAKGETVDPVSIILDQPDCPITITMHKCRFDPEDTGQYTYHSDRIEHEVNYKKVSEKEIVAIKFGFVEFDVFNDFLDGFSGIIVENPGIIKVIERKKGTNWYNYSYYAFTFDKYGTGIVYVSAVRFFDGTVWKADLDQVIDQLKKYESNLKKEDLERKNENIFELLKRLIQK